jgi:hypothetical protein
MVGESSLSTTTIECEKGADCPFPNGKKIARTKLRGLGHSPEEAHVVLFYFDIYTTVRK